MKFMKKYPLVYQLDPLPEKNIRDVALWTVVVKDELQFGLFRNTICKRYCVTVKALRRDWRELTGTEIPTDPDPFLGCETIKEYLTVTGVLDGLGGDQ